MKYTVDVRILAVRSREENVHLLQQKLNIPDEKVCYDTELTGSNFNNARRAWLLSSDATHVLVLSDDIEVCDNFLEYVNQCINKHPNSIISYFSLRMNQQYDTPYIRVRNKIVYGQAVSIPTKFIDTIWNYRVDPYLNPQPADDAQIILASIFYNYDVICIIPNLVQHKNYKTLVNNNTDRKSNIFIQDFNSSDINFNSDKVIELWE